MSTATLNPTERAVALRGAGITKRFGGTLALNGIDAAFPTGAVTAVVGANGSGKSTLLRILSGYMAPTDGTVQGPDGAAIVSLGSAQSQGVILVPQDPTLAEHLSVWQNVTLGRPQARRGPFTADREARAFAARHLEGLLPASALDVPVSTLNKSSKQLVQLAGAMARSPRVLLLDEPTAVLDEDGVEALHRLIRSFVRDGGTVLIVSHRLRDILELAQHAVVLRNGTVEFAGEVGPDSEAQIVRLLSEQEGERIAVPAPQGGEEVLVASSLKGIRGLDIERLGLRAGEIVGIAGQSGSGRSRLAAILAGAAPAEGTVSVNGRQITLGEIRSARALGVHYVPEDRLGNALLANQSVAANLLVGRRDGRTASRGFRRRAAETAQSAELIRRFDIRPPDPQRQAGLLSGGNQQKVIMARALADAPRVLIADEPTQGVDVGARGAIHDALAEAAADGTAVLVVCSEFEELFDVCHRILVIRDGRLVLRGAVDELTPEAVLEASLGADADPVPSAGAQGAGTPTPTNTHPEEH